MKKILLLISFLSLSLYAQIPCPPEGDAKDAKHQRLNRLKNRSNSVNENYFDPTITLEKMISIGYDDSTFDMRRWATITGWVYNVEAGALENCECHDPSLEARDTHITLCPDEKHIEGKFRIICEVTSRFRKIMKTRNIDWSSKTLRKTILHKWVKISGFLFLDVEHRNAAEHTHPKGKNNWRATITELHPVTWIELVNQNSIIKPNPKP